MKSRPLQASRFLAFATLAAVAALAACGGGGGGSSGTPIVRVTAAPITTAPPASSGLAPASFSIKIPGTGSSSVSRRTQTVNKATTSISFTLLKTDSALPTPPPNSFDVSGTSSLCVTAADTSRSCTLGISAPIGNDIYSVQTFDVSGNKLGSAAVAIKVLQNVANSASISLGGTIAGVSISILTAVPSATNNVLDATNGPKSVRLVVIGFDTAGNVILTPDTFTTPINLTFDPNLFPFSVKHHTLGAAPTPTPTPTPAVPTIQISVAYANPNGGPSTGTTTDLGGPITVTSPSDVVTVSALLPGPTFENYIGILATVGPPPATPLPSSPTSVPSGTVPTQSGVGFWVAAAPTPTPAPAIAFNIGTGPVGLTGSPGSQTFQFASAVATAVNITVTDPFMQTGTMTITNTCGAPNFDSPAASFTASLTAGALPPFKLETSAHDGLAPVAIPSAPTPTPFPTNAAACTITASDGTNTSTLNVSINNFTGTIQ